MMEEHKDILTVPEVAMLLRVGKVKVYELVKQKKIPAIQLGRSVRIPRKAFLEWLENQIALPAR